MPVSERLVETLGLHKNPGVYILIFHIFNVFHTMVSGMLHKRFPGHCPAINQSHSAHEFACRFAFGKVDPSTSSCLHPADFPIFLSSENQVKPVLLHYKSKCRRTLQSTPRTCKLFALPFGSIARISKSASGSGIARISKSASCNGIAR